HHPPHLTPHFPGAAVKSPRNAAIHAENRTEYALRSQGCQRIIGQNCVSDFLDNALRIARSHSSTSRNEKTRSRSRQPGLLVCRKEGLAGVGASEVPPTGDAKRSIFRAATVGGS